MTSPIERIYNDPDLEMLEHAATMQGNLAQYLGAFTAMFPFIDGAYSTAFLADITTANAYPLDGVVTANIKVLTQQLTNEMDTAYTALRTLDTYAKLAYPTSPAEQKVFGQDRWLDARNNTLKLIEALEGAYAYANVAPYKAALIAKGYTQPQINNLQTLAQSLYTKNQVQEHAIAGRGVSTQSRVQIYNTVYSRMQVVNLCANELYRDNPAMLQLFLLSATGGAASTIITIHAEDATAHTPLSGAAATITNLPIPVTVHADINGDIEFVNAVNQETIDITVTCPGYTDLVMPNLTIVLHDNNDFTAGLSVAP